MDMDTQHRFGHAAWTWTVDMHGCRNVDKKTQSGIVSFLLVYNAQSSIGIPASWLARYRWSQINPLVPSYGIFQRLNS